MKIEMHKLAAFLVAASLAAGLAGTAAAQPRHDGGREGWHDRDVHRFHDHDFDVWRTGRWYQGRHGGRAGWWWVLGDAWYYYPQPVYPYPDPFVPPVVVAPPPGPPRPGLLLLSAAARLFPLCAGLHRAVAGDAGLILSAAT